MVVVAALLGATACGNRGPRPPPGQTSVTRDGGSAADPEPVVAAELDAGPAVAAGAPSLDCERLPFARDIPIAEASGAVWLPQQDGVIVVVGDSGNHGAYLVLDDADGTVLAKGRLPLDGPGDDLEGLSTDGILLWAITSSGYLRAWRPAGADEKGYQLAVPAYPVEADGACEVDDVNCGHNFEGLCLAAAGRGAAGTPADQVEGCAGYAASKKSGELLCLVREGDRYRLDPTRSLAMSSPEALAACDIGPDGAVWTGDNLFGGTQVRRRHDGATMMARLGDGFPETMAIAPADGGAVIVFRFSDTSGSPSKASRHRCRVIAAPAARPE